MILLKCFLSISAIISYTFSVKINMHGTFSFGKDVLDTLNMFVRRNNMAPSAPTPFSADTDPLFLLVKSSYICRELSFCEGKLETLLNGYIALLTKAVEIALKYLTNENSAEEIELVLKSTKTCIFEANLKKLLPKIRKLLINTNMIVTEKNEQYLWTDVTKTISAMFQESAIEYAKSKVGGDSDLVGLLMKKLTQKFVIATLTVESVCETKLCAEHNICPKSHECTTGLRTIFGAFKNSDNEKAVLFIKYFSAALLDTKFYSHLRGTTAEYFQIVLDQFATERGSINNAHTENISAKELLLGLLETVEYRINSLNTNTQVLGGKDMELGLLILSDMDHIFANGKVDPFHVFLSRFLAWVKSDGKLTDAIREVMSEIAARVYEAPQLLRAKLIRHVRVFLELTTNPE